MSKLIFVDSVRRFSLHNVRLSSRLFIRNFSDEKNPEDEKPPKTNEKLKKSTEKLNYLLKSMLEDESKKPAINVSLAQPTKKFAKRKQKEREESESSSDELNENIIKATKDVAEHIGGDIQQTESELLMKLLLRKDVNEASTESEPTSLSDLIVGMKIDRSRKPPDGPMTRAQHVRRNLADKPKELHEQHRKGKRHTRDFTARIGQRVELFGGVGLGIFQKSETTKNENQLSTMEYLHQRELKLAIMHPPENYFQKMMLWTEQGKLWKFPIDNEQGMEEEQNVYFAEHVFLDTHLEGWCPSKGPVRHFMELVCVGLSKNPYLSVQEKKNHIEWFRDYFKEKENLLKEVGALQSNISKETDTTKTLT